MRLSGAAAFTIQTSGHGIFLAPLSTFGMFHAEMHFYENHRLQTIFVILQVLVIMIGSLVTGGMMKIMGYDDAFSERWSPFLRFIRNWGFLLILIPLAWTIFTVALEQRAYWYSKRWTMGSGLLVLALLGWLLLQAMLGAISCDMTMSDQ